MKILFHLVGAIALLLAVPVLAEEAIGPGDVINITVFGQDELSTRTEVSPAGTVTLPLINQVDVAGLTLREIEGRISDLLRNGNLVRNPRVTVYLEQHGTPEAESVVILGQVKHPGRFSANPTTDGASTVLGLLALAGGVSEGAGDLLLLTRQTEDGLEINEVDLVALLREGDLTRNLTISGRDVLLVPPMNVFYVFGEVRRPGRYRLERGMTVAQALSVGGGLTPKGTERGVSIRRRDEAGELRSINVKLDDELSRDDVLYVREGLF